ncbi:hypothetical protein Ciccas_005816 [Cichlidogyrus casuarinus]|uniref:Uncharacterized protein n=1 Tax=Cichlidogyrus casuarinus TaxID=1844966 RepID=A0ABD2Q8J3_9PLAT
MNNFNFETDTEGLVDHYKRSLEDLKEMTDVDYGPFEGSFRETIAQCDNVEAQLHNMESWLNLSILVNPTSRTGDIDPDSAACEAQSMCRITDSIRNSLQTLVTNPSQSLKKDAPEY